jgi:4-amino-4-deoxy-L-arabinose transferase-like glycosyltransferase
MPRRFFVALAVIAVAAFGIRIAFVEAHGDRALTTGDSFFYYSVARQIADGEGYVRPYELAASPSRSVQTAEHPPLYPLILAVPAALGFRSLHELEAFSSLIGTLGVVMVALLARKLAGPWAALVAGGIAAVYPMFFQPAALLFAEVLFIPLLAGALLVSYSLIERPTLPRFCVLGVLIGLAALTRGEGVLLLLGLGIPLVWRSYAGWGQRFQALVVVGLAVGIVFGPWMIRNEVVFDRFVPASTNTTTAIAGANCPATYSGTRLGSWDLYCVYGAYAQYDKKHNRPGTIHNEAADLAPGTTAGLRYMSHHLGRLPVVLAARVLRTWNLWNPSSLLTYDQGDNGVRSWLIVGYAMFLVMLPLAFAGAFVLRRRRVPIWPLVVPMVVVTFMSMALHGATRFRQGAEPSIIVLAAVALVALSTRTMRGLRGAPHDEGELAPPTVLDGATTRQPVRR